MSDSAKLAQTAGTPAQYGGQAVIEGVMMRGPHHFAVAARRANGEIALTCEAVPKSLRPGWQKLPFLRGAFAIVDSMTLGTRAMFWAAKIAEQGIEKTKSATTSAPVTDTAVKSAMFAGLAIAVVMVKVLPQLAIEAAKHSGITAFWQIGLIDIGIRFTILFGYIALISRQRYVRRVFQYHGAEHKSINALEAGGPLTVETARAQSRLHPRCGTSFVVIVILLSVLASVGFYGLPIWYRIPIGLVTLFPVAGVSFELLRLAGRFRNNPIADALSRPGMWTQLLTTREPDDSQLEVAIASLKAVMDAEKTDKNPLDGL